jgi:Fe-Mn family superoxide dismutase
VTSTKPDAAGVLHDDGAAALTSIPITSVELLRALSRDSVAEQTSEVPAALLVGLLADFGSIDAWRADFEEEVIRRFGSPGWVVLALSLANGSLRNQWHGMGVDTLHGEPSLPLLAYELGDNADRAIAQLARFVAHVDWTNVARLYQSAAHDVSILFAADPADVETALLLDVRRKGAFDASDESIAEATWHDPTRVDTWASELVLDHPVIVYCVAGHEVSRKVTLRLRGLGFDAHFLAGGIEGWKAANRPTTKRIPVP